jgi:asparagine synthase (glutamine-hydrolysing)
MCGIVGVYNLDGRPVAASVVKSMTDSLRHRGPDGEGLYVDGPIGLGHRRLAIIDLSPAGQQPMANATGEVLITYNGEIYNFQTLRVQLEALGHRFRSQTDTEVAVHAYETWGRHCVDRFNGMYAFAIWDGPQRCLFLARDRYGIKPLYYMRVGQTFLFASEIKALLRHPAVQATVCYEALSEYFTFQNVLSDLTLFEGIRLLPAGCALVVDGRGVQQRRYWDYQFDTADCDLTPEEAAAALFQRFERAVMRQLVSDVPVGSYLSGGMDSGSITAVATRHIRRLSTFTCGFDLSSASGLELGFDERAASEVMANLFKTEHYEMVLHAGDMEYVLPLLIWHLEDLRVGQCYPNYYVARLASRFVKVVLSGSGGDELFAGYPWRYYRGRHNNGAGDYYRRYYEYWQRLIPDEDRRRFFRAATYKSLRDHEPFTAFRGVFAGHPPSFHTPAGCVNAALYFEAKTFLHGLFVVEDKVGMAHGLETRFPFMDNDLVDFSLRLPPQLKLRNVFEAPVIDENEQGKLRRYQQTPSSDGKLVLRAAMSRLVPPDILGRVKQGFSAPDASWFRGESIEYINRFLRDPKARICEYLSPVYVHKVLDEHSTGQHNHRLLIWSLLSFEWWCRLFLEGAVPCNAADNTTA